MEYEEYKAMKSEISKEKEGNRAQGGRKSQTIRTNYFKYSMRCKCKHTALESTQSE